MALESEVSNNRQSIRSDGYAMSIGEVANLYRDGEIKIRPEFQRLFRWDIEKQSRLIESLLLDIPVPPIFVAQRGDGVWEVVDGLQRLSTILQFLGDLRDEETGKVQPSSTLVKTRYLPSLEGRTYDGEGSGLPVSLRLQFRRSRLDFRILLKESDDKVKYELFDRLNSGGEPTSPQEVRTALILMTSPGFFEWLDGLRKNEDVQESLALTERQTNEQYDLDLLIRFLVYSQSTDEELRSFSDIDTFLTERVLEMAADPDFDKDAMGQKISSVFNVVSSVGPNVFRKYDERRGRTVGAFSVSAFEAVTFGLSKNIVEWLELKGDEVADQLTQCARNLWSDENFRRYSGAGVRATTRAPKMAEVGPRIVSPRKP